MKSRIQVLSVVQNAGRSKKTGNDYDMRMAQCIVHKQNRDTGEILPLVGVLLLPEKYKDIAPGDYLVEFEVAISRDTRVESAVYSMEPFVPGQSVAPVSGQQRQVDQRQVDQRQAEAGRQAAAQAAAAAAAAQGKAAP